MEWLNKYSPKKISDFISNSQAVETIISWLDTFEENKILQKNQKKRNKNTKKPNLLISGQHGVGKSTTVEIILNEKNYLAHMFNNYVKTEQSLKSVMDKITSCGNILSMVNGEKKNVVIIIESIESITATIDKGCIINLLKLNDIHWYCPIILISNGQHAKLLSEIKKISMWIKMFPPYGNEMYQIVSKITKNEKINLKNNETIQLIIDHSQYDIRRLITMLHDIKITYGQKEITKEIINEYLEYSQKKDIDFDLFKATNKLLYDYNNINDCLIDYESEKVLLPLMIHQYYINLVSNTKQNIKTLQTVRLITDSMSYGDVIENCIYSEQNWDISDVHGYHTCVYPSYILNKDLPKNTQKINLKFAENFNNTNIKQINKKNILNASKCFKDMSIFDFMCVSKIMRKLMKNNKTNECNKILKKYNVKTEHMESLFRIDKIKNTKTCLSTKQKRDYKLEDF